LSGQATAQPKSRDGIVESIRVLRNARASAVKARVQAVLHLQNLVVTAPDELREPLRALTTTQLVERCARMHRPARLDSTGATRVALRTLPRRHQTQTTEIAELDAMLSRLTAQAAPRLIKQPGIGPEIAARMLLVAGDNPTRLRNDSALGALCGASPIEASSGKTTRHRLNRGGARQANSALWLSANNRMIHHPQTRDYVKRRTANGTKHQRDPPLPHAPHRPRPVSPAHRRPQRRPPAIRLDIGASTPSPSRSSRR
jgi:transposase